MAVVQHQAGSLVADLSRVLASGEGSDLTLLVGNSKLPAHSFIMSVRSPVFAAMLRHETLESTSRRVEIQDMEEEVARQLLSFIYTDETPLLSKLASQLLAASDKYDLPLLRQRCEQQLVRDLAVENAAAAAVLATQHSCPELKERAVDFIRAFPLEVMATEGWQEGLCSQPKMVTEVSRLVTAALSPSHPLSESRLSAPSDSRRIASTQPKSNLSRTAAAAAPPTNIDEWQQTALPEDASSHFWAMPAEEESLLLQAAQEGAVGELRVLLAKGVDVGARDGDRWTALHCAADRGDEEAVNCLLQAGAEVDARDNWQQTPLHLAASCGHTAVVRLLLGAGAGLNVRNDSWWTPLHCAARRGEAEAATVLLEAGADREARDRDGDTPLDIVRKLVNILRY